MVIFHLAYFGDKYPYAKDIVYTFHMPAFLIISGYLLNVSKPAREFEHRMIWIFIPYAIMEAAYIIASAFMPVRGGTGGTDNLSVWSSIQTILFAPIGPYWYLHTLIICYLVYYATSRLRPRLGVAATLCLMGVAFYAADELLHIVSINNAMYFMAGAAVRMCGVRVMSAFSPTLLSAVPLALLCAMSPDGLDRSTLQGVVMTWLAMSFALAAYPYLGDKLKTATHFIGENTLAILLFSPMFTIIAKRFVPLFSFDPTAMLYTAVSVAFTIAGSVAVAYMMDRLKLSRWFSGKKLYNAPQ